MSDPATINAMVAAVDRPKSAIMVPGGLKLYLCERGEEDDYTSMLVSAADPEEAARLCWQWHTDEPIAGNEDVWREDQITVYEVTARFTAGVHSTSAREGLEARIVASEPA